MASALLSPKASDNRVLPSEILDEIFAYTPRSALAVCLRTSRQLFEPAGRALYRNVRIDGTNVIQFFRGAPLDTGAQDHVRNCSLLARKDLPHCNLIEGRTPCDRLHTCAFSDAGSLELAQSSAVESPPTKHTSRRGRDVSAQPTATKRRRADESGRAIEEDHGSDGYRTASSISDDARGSDTPVNLKAELLKHVRVLTLATHHLCQCDVYAPVAARLLPNLDTLRIVPSIGPMVTHTPELAYFCDSVQYGSQCHFLQNLACRKLVFRNLDGSGLDLIEPDAANWMPNVEEVVYFLPRDGQYYECEFGASLQDLNQVFAAAKSVKFVYFPKWEGWDNMDDLCRDLRFPRKVARPTDIQMPFMYQDLNRQLVAIGLERVDFHTDPDADDLLEIFREFCPDEEHLDQKRVLQIVKHEINTLGLSTAEVRGTYNRPGSPGTVDGDGPVSFVGLAQYLLNDPAASIEVGDHLDIFLAFELFHLAQSMRTG